LLQWNSPQAVIAIYQIRIGLCATDSAILRSCSRAAPHKVKMA
jgi:hypothetical protein